MPRPIIKQEQAPHLRNLTTTPTERDRKKAATGKLRLGKRSSRYMDALAALDPSQNTADVDMAAVHDAIDAEFRPSVDLFPDGIMARCYLGTPYQVHALDLTASVILEHYKRGEPAPGILERARKLALHPSYLCIEVYPNYLVCVRHDGSTSELR
jgi:hypothetical protein